MNTQKFQKQVEKILFFLKNGKQQVIPYQLESILPNGKKIKMYVITGKMMQQQSVIETLARWRESANIWFPTQFSVTFEGTKKWAINQLHNKPDRVLFFLQLMDAETPLGHIGLYRFNYRERSCEIDNVIRGESSENTKGAMTVGIQLLIDWVKTYLGIDKIYLQVFSDNEKAVKLYKNLGFQEVSRIALISVADNNMVKWVEAPKDTDKKDIKRYFVRMLLNK